MGFMDDVAQHLLHAGQVGVVGALVQVEHRFRRMQNLLGAG
jgi:hypothetical protein